MREIWYLLKCPEGDETDYTKKYLKFVLSKEMEKIVCFQYQRMIRYGGKWHLENRMVLPGHIFLFGENVMALKRNVRKDMEIRQDISLRPCEVPCLNDMCQNGNVIEMSRGVIQKGVLVITSGPLKGREALIRKINRHKRIAEIEIVIAGGKKRITVGLEIYEKVI